ncbi:MAG: 2-oxoacid:acceptor oxidoreductase family protein [Deltaproteobacteria bacterium]|nr:2-oxoacid:acceptor oxidoreductase family protein [Deltaproteobacteria bacterium]
MAQAISQQVVISGLGGQGVLFVTRLLAEAAIEKELPVFTSETHGMAQRGGVVLSHLKVGDFSSPLIRPLQADGLLVLKAENMARHGFFLKPGGWAVVNADGGGPGEIASAVDADRLARQIANPRAVNLIVLGYALAAGQRASGGNGRLFCSYEDVKTVLKSRFGRQKKMLKASLQALQAGFHARPA